MNPAEHARHNANLTIEEAARRARICIPYLQRVERSGDCSYVLAIRLARLYRCSANVFLYTKGSETPATSKRLSRNTAQQRSA